LFKFWGKRSNCATVDGKQLVLTSSSAENWLSWLFVSSVGY
jgi:hypothetical protein